MSTITVLVAAVITFCALKSADATVRPFEISINAAQVELLHHRLDSVMWPSSLSDDESVTDWNTGPPVDVMLDLTQYLRSGYNFTQQVEAMNAIPQFIASIGDLEVHFIHQRSAHEHAVPLMFVHVYHWLGDVMWCDVMWCVLM